MSNFDKIVKGACKPKNQPPKAKYVDQLVSATFSSDGSINDITRSLSLRLREPNAVVVFKALLTLHQMIRQGSTEALLEHLAGGDSLRLRNVGSGNWEGYSPPSSMSKYAGYLDSRIRAWRELKHDLVKVQADSNKRSDGLGAASRRLRHLPVEKGLLREVQQVQKVLDALLLCKFYDDDLKDENTVLAFRMLVKDVLVLFQAGNEGVCNILEHYFEMSKPDAQAAFDIYKSFIKQTDRVVDYLGVARKLQNVVNVPVPNLKHAPTSLVKALEEYLNDPNFEQNRLEYKKSLGVVEGRGEGRTPSPNPAKKEEQKPKLDTSSSTTGANGSASTSAPASAASPIANAPPGASRKIQDFFDSIQSDHQPTMFGGPAQQLNYGSINTAFNPFRASMAPQPTGMTGMPGAPMGFGMVQPQMTGFPNQFGQPQPQAQHPFMQPQQTGQPFLPAQTGPTPFHQPQPQGFQQAGFMASPQAQQQTGFLQPQATGSNPFRQSTMFGGAGPINTGVGVGQGGNASAFSQPSSPFHASAQAQGPVRSGSVPIGGGGGGGGGALQPQATGAKNPFAPAGGVKPASQTQTQGQGQGQGPSMNEMAWGRQFGQGQAQAQGPGQGQAGSPWGGIGANGTGNGSGNAFGGASSPVSGFGGGGGAGAGALPGAKTQGSGMSDIASAFASSSTSGAGGQNGNGTGVDDFFAQFGALSTGTGTGSASTSSPAFGASSSAFSFSSQPTGSSATSTGTSATTDLFSAFGSPSGGAGAAGGVGGGQGAGGGGGFIQPQPTGFGGSTVKRFQPTSSFGRQAIEGLGTISESPGLAGPGGGQGGQGGYPFSNGGGSGSGSGAGSGGQQLGQQQQPTGTGVGTFGFGQGQGQPQQSSSPQPFGSGLGGGGMGAQMTGAGAGANPFRQGSAPMPFGAGAGPGMFGANGPFGQPQQQQGGFGQGGGQGGGSLI